jgi:hypothetical protein
MQTLDNLKEQIAISKQIDILMAQTLKLMDIINENQKQVNDLKAEQEKLKLMSSDDVKGGW